MGITREMSKILSTSTAITTDAEISAYNYLSQSTASATYAPKASPTFTGPVSSLGTINGATLEDTGWISVSSFANNFTAPQAVSYRKINNVVYFRGCLFNGTANTGAFTLPTGYRPAATSVIAVQQYGTPNINYVTVGTDGVVVPNGTAAWLSNVIFPVE